MRTLAIAILACLATHAAAADQEANKALIRSYIEEVFNKHQPSAADCFVATDFIEHNPPSPAEPRRRETIRHHRNGGLQRLSRRASGSRGGGRQGGDARGVDRHQRWAARRSAGDRQQAGLFDFRLLPYRKRKGRRTLGRSEFACARGRARSRRACSNGVAADTPKGALAAPGGRERDA